MRALVYWAVVLAACTHGSEPTGDATMQPPTGVATFHVTLDGDGSIDPHTVNLAIEWYRDPKVWPQRLLEPQQLLITQYSLSWPMTIDAVLPQRPTYDPYYSSPSVGARRGRLVAYIDGNHNDQLDFTPIDADAFTDRLVGYTAGNEIHYYTTVDTFS